MKNSEVWDIYTARTEAVSRNARALGFVAGGSCWILQTPNQGLAALLSCALLLVVTFFLLDTIQYIQPAAFLRKWIRSREVEIYEKTGQLDGERYELPAEHDTLPYNLWRTKLCILGIAWLLIVIHVAKDTF